MLRTLAAALVLTLLVVPLAACSSPEEYHPPGTPDPKLAVGSEEARVVVDQFVAALCGKDTEAAGALLCGRAMEASRTLSGASSVEILSVAEDTGTVDAVAKIFEVQADVTYPEKSSAQSGVYTYRLRVVRTESGLRIENLGP